jgi:hypothetical protein
VTCGKRKIPARRRRAGISIYRSLGASLVPVAATVYVVVTRLDVKVIAMSSDLRCVVVEVSCIVEPRLVPIRPVRRAITVRLIDVTAMSTAVPADLRTNEPTNQSAQVSTPVMSTAVISTTVMSTAVISTAVMSTTVISAAVMSAAVMTAAMSTVTIFCLCLVAKSESECGGKCNGNDHFRA